MQDPREWFFLYSVKLFTLLPLFNPELQFLGYFCFVNTLMPESFFEFSRVFALFYFREIKSWQLDPYQYSSLTIFRREIELTDIPNQIPDEDIFQTSQMTHNFVVNTAPYLFNLLLVIFLYLLSLFLGSSSSQKMTQEELQKEEANRKNFTSANLNDTVVINSTYEIQNNLNRPLIEMTNLGQDRNGENGGASAAGRNQPGEPSQVGALGQQFTLSQREPLRQETLNPQSVHQPPLRQQSSFGANGNIVGSVSGNAQGQ